MDTERSVVCALHIYVKDVIEGERFEDAAKRGRVVGR